MLSRPVGGGVVSRSTVAPFVSRWRGAFTRTMHGLERDGLTPAAVAVGLVLADYADWHTGGGIRPGRKRVALTVGVSVATVGRCIAALVAAEWLATDERGSFGRSSTYRLTIPPQEKTDTGEITPPVIGSPVSLLPDRNRLTGEPLKAAQTIRNRLTGAHPIGSPVSHHLYQDLRPSLAPVGIAS